MNTAISDAINIVGTQAKLAVKAGLSQQHISRLLKGQQRITAETAIKIEQATDGQVSRGDLCPHLWPSDAGRAA